MSEKFPASWIHGAENCPTSTDPAFQIHRFDESTYIIRQSKCLNFEGPFLYLLAGEDTAFLFDSGATPVNDAPLPIREAVDSILKEILESRGQPPEQRISLIVGHTHAHADHLAGDRCLQSRPDTVIIPPTLQGLKRFFSIRDWSNDLGILELGSRRLTIIPTPGHEDLHICIYDSQTKILLSGDILYPGKLVINDWTAYRKSAEKLYKFSLENEISYILGAHIEMKNTPGELYEIGTTFQPDEHSLELKPEHLTNGRRRAGRWETIRKPKFTTVLSCGSTDNCFSGRLETAFSSNLRINEVASLKRIRRKIIYYRRYWRAICFLRVYNRHLWTEF